MKLLLPLVIIISMNSCQTSSQIDSFAIGQEVKAAIMLYAAKEDKKPQANQIINKIVSLSQHDDYKQGLIHTVNIVLSKELPKEEAEIYTLIFRRFLVKIEFYIKENYPHLSNDQLIAKYWLEFNQFAKGLKAGGF